MNRVLWIVLSVCFLAALSFATSCQDEDAANGLGESDDDDLPGDDDDSAVDDDDDDDDNATTPNGDDDTSPNGDDDDDDDNDDDDMVVDDLFIELVDGGGDRGSVSLAVTPAGAVAIAQRRGGMPVLSLLRPDESRNKYVFNENEFSGAPAVAADADGKLHLMYVDSPSGALIYATDRTGAWSECVVDEQAGSGDSTPVIRVDRDGVVHAGYRLNYYHLYYLRNETGEWTGEDLGLSPSYGAFDMAIDDAGQAHFAYSSARGYYYGTNSGGGWSGGMIAGYSDTNTADIAIALGSDAVPRVVFVDSGIDALYQGIKEDKAWQVEVIADDVHALHTLALALDAEDRPHLVLSDYDRNENDTLYYFSRPAGEWRRETLESGAAIVYGSALAFDAAGNLHLSYVTEFSDYAVKSSSGVWSNQRVDDPGRIGDFATAPMAAGRHGRLHLAYLRQPGDEVHYARYRHGEWHHETVGVAAGLGSYVSLAVDRHGRAHLAVYRKEVEDLVYLTNRGGEWRSETIDAFAAPATKAFGDDSVYPAIAVDATGHAFIAYTRDDTQVVFATNRSGQWTRETIYTNPYWQLTEKAVAVDANGRAHLAVSHYRLLWDPPYYQAFGKLQYLTEENGAWESREIYRGPDGGFYPDLVTTAEGAVLISYPVRADGLHLATISGGSVTDEVIGDSGYDGAAVEADDRGCIQAAGIGDEAVDYFFNCGDGWQTTPIDKSIHDSEYVYLALADGAVHLAYTHTDAVWHAAFPSGYREP